MKHVLGKGGEGGGGGPHRRPCTIEQGRGGQVTIIRPRRWVCNSEKRPKGRRTRRMNSRAPARARYGFHPCLPVVLGILKRMVKGIVKRNVKGLVISNTRARRMRRGPRA